MKDLKTWLEARKTGIGGSDAAAISGLNKYSSPTKVYMQKLGLLPPTEENDAMMLGTRFESAIRDIYAERHGVRVVVPETIIRNKQYDFIIGTPDGIVVDDKGEWLYGLEIKYTGRMSSAEWGESGSDNVPSAYYLQCQHYMVVTGLDRWDLAAVCGSTIKFYIINRDEAVVNDLIKIETDFWLNHVLAQNPPPIDGSEASTELLKAMFPKSNGYIIPADDRIEDLALLYRGLSVAVEEDLINLNAAKNKIIALMGDAEGCQGNGFFIKYKSQSTGTMTDWKCVAKELQKLMPAEEFEALVDANTKQKKDSRPFKVDFE